MLEGAVQDAGPDGELEVRALGGQRIQAALGAPGQVAAQVRFGVLAGGALEASQVGGHCQPQPVGERLRGIGGRGGQLGKGRHALTLQRLAGTVKLIDAHLAAWADIWAGCRPVRLRFRQSVQAPASPARGWLVRRDGQQDPSLGGQGPQMLLVIRYGHPVLLPDSPEPGQLRGDILPDLHGGRDQHGAEPGGIVNEQLRSRVPAEDRVFHPASCRGHVEPLAVPAEPVGTQVRAPVTADPSDDDVTRLSQKRLDLLCRCHPRTLSEPLT